MSVELTKVQWQTLGGAVRDAGYTPDSFVRTFEDSTDGSKADSVVLTERESSYKFKISPQNSQFRVDFDIPGTTRVRGRVGLDWESVTSFVRDWAVELKQENEANDPWATEAEDMANDDSYFTLGELPKVDEAINRSLSELHDRAIEHGMAQERVEAELDEIKSILRKSARNSTKREWITLFKGMIVEKLVDWGMQTAIFQAILHVLITSAQEIHQLAEHASRHLP